MAQRDVRLRLILPCDNSSHSGIVLCIMYFFISGIIWQGHRIKSVLYTLYHTLSIKIHMSYLCVIYICNTDVVSDKCNKHKNRPICSSILVYRAWKTSPFSHMSCRPIFILCCIFSACNGINQCKLIKLDMKELLHTTVMSGPVKQRASLHSHKESMPPEVINQQTALSHQRYMGPI